MLNLNDEEFIQAVDRKIYAVTSQISEMVHGFEFAKLLSAYYHAYLDGDDETKVSNNVATNSFSKALSNSLTPRVRLYSGNSHDNEESSAVIGSTVKPIFQILTQYSSEQ